MLSSVFGIGKLFFRGLGRSRLCCSRSQHIDAALTPLIPKSFGNDFHIPPYLYPLPLETINKHEMDEKITFDESTHTYMVEGIKISKSVTKLTDEYFQQFDADSVITKMKNGKNWPRAQYLKQNGTVWSDLEIKASWDNNSNNARNRGTFMHWNIERYINGYKSIDELPEMKYFLNFYEDQISKKGIVPFRTEWRIAAPDLDLAGSVDFVGKLGSEYVIIDWKRSKKLPMTDNSFITKCKSPIQHIDDCTTSRYFLQFNIYRYLLQTYYNIPISKMILANFDPNSAGYYFIEVPVWNAEVKQILSIDPKKL